MSLSTAEHMRPSPPLTGEQYQGHERLTHETLRREMAKVAVLAMMLTALNRPDSDHLFIANRTNESGEGEQFLALLAHVLKPGWDAAHSAEEVDQEKLFAPTFGMRDFSPFDNYTREPIAKPDFIPAPSMAETPQGPQLPQLAFNDRIRPWASKPSTQDFRSATRANEMYSRALFDNGWRGGGATSDQQKAARLAMVREYHPDRADVSSADAEAFKIFNANYSANKQAAKTQQVEDVPRPPEPPAEKSPQTSGAESAPNH